MLHADEPENSNVSERIPRNIKQLKFNRSDFQVSAESVRLPTLKELIGYETIFTHDYTSTTPLTLSIRNFSEDYAINLNERNNYADKILKPTTKNDILSKSSSTNVNGVKYNRFKTEDQTNAFGNQKTAEGGKKTSDQNYSDNSPFVAPTTTPYLPITIPIRILSGNRKKLSRTRAKKIVIPVRIFEFDTPLTEVAIEVPESELPNGLNSSLRFEVINQQDMTIISRIKNNEKEIQYRGNSESHDAQAATRRTDKPTEKYEFTNYIENEKSPIFTTPRVSTIRGTSWTPTTKSGNRGFYVTKSLDSNIVLDELGSTTPMQVDKSHDDSDSALDVEPTANSSTLTSITDSPFTMPMDSITPDITESVEFTDASVMTDENTSTEVDTTFPALEEVGNSKSDMKPLYSELFRGLFEEDESSATNLSTEEPSDENRTPLTNETTTTSSVIDVSEITTLESDKVISTVSDVDDLLAVPSSVDNGKSDSGKGSAVGEASDFGTENSDIELSSSLPDEISTTDANVDMLNITNFSTSNTVYDNSGELYSAVSQSELQRVHENHNLTMSVEGRGTDDTRFTPITESATDNLQQTTDAYSEVTDSETQVGTESSTDSYHDFSSVTPDSSSDVEQTSNDIHQFSTILNSKSTAMDFATNLNMQSTTTPYSEQTPTLSDPDASTIEFEKNIDRQSYASSATATSDFRLAMSTDLSVFDAEAKKHGPHTTTRDFVERETTTSYVEKTTNTQDSHDSWNDASSDLHSIVPTEASNLDAEWQEEKTEARSTTPYFFDTTTDSYSETSKQDVQNQIYPILAGNNAADLEHTTIGNSWDSDIPQTTLHSISTEMTYNETSEIPEFNEMTSSTTDPTTTSVLSTVDIDDQNLTTMTVDHAHDDEDADGRSIASSDATTLESTTDFFTTTDSDINPTSSNYETSMTSSDSAPSIFPTDTASESDATHLLSLKQSTDGETATETIKTRKYDEQQRLNSARRTSILTTTQPTTSSTVRRRSYRPFISGTNPTVGNNRRDGIKIIRRRPVRPTTATQEARATVSSTSTNTDAISNASGKTRPKIIRRRVINRSTGKIVKEDLVERKIISDSGNTNDVKPEFVGNAMKTQDRENISAARLSNRRIIYRNRPAAMNRHGSNVSSQNNGASNDMQSSSVLRTDLNKKRQRIVVKRLRSRGTGVTKPSTELENISSSDSTANTVVETRANTADGRDDDERTEFDNSYGGSEIFSRISPSGSEAPLRTESFFEAQIRSKPTAPLGNEQASSEINLFKNRASQSRKPGTLVRPSKITVNPESELSSTSAPSTQLPVSATRRRNFRPGQRPVTPIPEVVDETQSRTVVPPGDTMKLILDGETSESINQSRPAEEPPTTVSTIQQTTVSPSAVTGRPLFRTAIRRRISTTVTPRVEVLPSTTTPVIRQRKRPQPFERVSSNAPVRSRRPAIVDYDYYEDEEKRIVGKPKLSGKISVTTQGTIRCLDQGNFPHPQSCKKFITCARMVNGQVIATEYTCPDKLSFDPVGGICNWSAGLGCKE